MGDYCPYPCHAGLVWLRLIRKQAPVVVMSCWKSNFYEGEERSVWLIDNWHRTPNGRSCIKLLLGSKIKIDREVECWKSESEEAEGRRRGRQGADTRKLSIGGRDELTRKPRGRGWAQKTGAREAFIKLWSNEGWGSQLFLNKPAKSGMPNLWSPKSKAVHNYAQWLAMCSSSSEQIVKPHMAGMFILLGQQLGRVELNLWCRQYCFIFLTQIPCTMWKASYNALHLKGTYPIGFPASQKSFSTRSTSPFTWHSFPSTAKVDLSQQKKSIVILQLNWPCTFLVMFKAAIKQLRTPFTLKLHLFMSINHFSEVNNSTFLFLCRNIFIPGAKKARIATPALS